MGLGKTLMALLTAKKTGLKTLVFGPAFLESNWLREAIGMGVRIDYIPYSQLHKHRMSDLKDYKFFIADEAHFLKNPTAQRTHSFYSLLKEIRPDYFIGLTGTPIKNRVPDFWTLLAFCSNNPLPTNGLRLEGDLQKYYKFSRHFCQVQTMMIRGRKIEKFVGIKEDKIPELKSLLKDKYIRYTIDQVLTELPPITRKYIDFDLAEDKAVRQDFENYMTGNKYDIKGKVASAMIKADCTIEYVKNLLEEECGPFLIFSDHVEPAKKISSAIKGSIVVTGQTPVRERNVIVNNFQTGVIPAVVATIGSLSVGVTLHKARHVIFSDLSWVPSDNKQAEARIHRIGQQNACFAHYIEATPTDAYIRRTLFQKQETINKVVG